MKKFMRILVFTMAFLISRPLLQAQSDIRQIPPEMQERISLDLRNILVEDVLKFLSDKTGMNIVSTKGVSGRVTLRVENVSVKDVFDIMLRSNGLAYSKEGEIYNVMTEDEFRALFGRRFADLREVKTFRLRYAIPEQAFSLMDALKSEIGRVLVEPDSGTALIMDTPQAIKKIEEALSALEKETHMQVFQLNYARARDIEEQLKVQLDAKGVGLVRADERTNQLIIQALPERMPGIENLVALLDKKTQGALIDTKIVKVKLSDELTTGIEWEGLFNAGQQAGMMYAGSYPYSVLQPGTEPWMSRKQFLDTQTDATGGSVGAYPFSGSGSGSAEMGSKVAPGERMHIGIIGKNRDFDVLIRYLQTLGKTQIISNPKLAVLNNQEAKIHVGERQAYVTTTTTTGQATTTVSEEVTFVDVGIQLSITATINEQGYITMRIRPEVSSVVGSLRTPSGNLIPIIDTSIAETTVMVKDGSTIIIGGLRKEEQLSSSDQVPILGKIPFLGFFFRSARSRSERTELLVIITPHIVSGDTLVTGDERYFASTGKDYKEYLSFTEGADFRQAGQAREREIIPQGREEGEIKPYREYSPFKEENKEDSKATPKGVITYE